MKKLFIVIITIIILCVVGGTIFWLTVEEAEYLTKERIFYSRYHRYDALILEATRRHNVPPELVKAVIWRESRFQPDKVGQHGERGLMQITEAAASDWARVEKVPSFAPTDLFDPKTNIEAGTWYLRRALEHWAAKDNAIPFALAEYNAGRTRVKRWVKESGRGEVASAEDMQTAMDFPLTKSYINAIVSRFDFYKERGDFNR